MKNNILTASAILTMFAIFAYSMVKAHNADKLRDENRQQCVLSGGVPMTGTLNKKEYCVHNPQMEEMG